MERARRLQIRQLAPELTCHLCKGYFVDAFTVVECLHSFCKSCIMDHVKKSCECPTCGTQLNKARLTAALRPDQTLQSVVYKLVPRLFNDEMQRRRDFYQDHPRRDRSLSPERRGDVSSQQFVHTLTDPISFSLQFSRSGSEEDEKTDLPAVRYFQAPAGLGVSHLKKLLHLKHGLGPQGVQIDIMYAGDILADELIIMDVAYMYNWDRTAPMSFSYRYTAKRPLAGELAELAVSPSKRRCRDQRAELQSGADSDKENVENDARPMTVTAAAAVAAAAAVEGASPATKPVGKPLERLARQPAVRAAPETPREAVTSAVTSSVAAAAGPSVAPADPEPAACTGGRTSGDVTNGQRQSGAASVERTDAADGDRTTQGAAVGENSDAASGEKTDAANGEKSGVTNGEENDVTNCEKNDVTNGEKSKVANGERSDVANAEKTKVANSGKSETTVVTSAKKSAVSGFGEESNVVSNKARNVGVAEKTTAIKHPSVKSNGEKLPRKASARDAVMVASGEMKHVDRQGTKRPPGPARTAPQPSKHKADLSKSSAPTSGTRIFPKPVHTVQSHPKTTQVTAKPPSSCSGGNVTSKLSHSSEVLKHSASAKHHVFEKAQSASPRMVSNDSPIKESAVQSPSASMPGAPPNIPNKIGSMQTGGLASSSNVTNPSFPKTPTSATDIIPGPAPPQNGGVSKPGAPTKPHAPAPTHPAQKETVVAVGGGPASILTPVSRSERTPSGGDGTEPTAAADRQCEDSGVDTDSSERPAADSARSPIDVYDFDAEAEDETAVRLKAPGQHLQSALSRTVPMTKVSRPAGVGVAEARQASPVVRVTTPEQRSAHPGVSVASVQRPLPPGTPAGSCQRPVPPSTPGVSYSQRAVAPSIPTVHTYRPTPPNTTIVPTQCPIPPSTTTVYTHRPPSSSSPMVPPHRPAPPSTSVVPPPSTPAVPPPSTSAVPPHRPAPSSTPALSAQRSLSPSTPGVSPTQHPAPSPSQRPELVPVPSPVPASPRRSLASLPDLRPIGAGAIPLLTGQLDRFLRMVSRSAVSQPNGSWRLPADASSLLTRAAAPTQLLTRAAAPTQLALGKPIQPKPVQGQTPGQTKPTVQARSGVQKKPVQAKHGVQHRPTAATQVPQKALNQKYRLSGTHGIQNLVTNEITITKIPNTSRAASSSPGGRLAPSPLPAEPCRSPGSGPPVPRVTADGSVTIEKVRAAQPPPVRPPNSPKLLAIAESLAMRKIQSQQRPAESRAVPPTKTAPPSATSGLLPLPQTQQPAQQRVLEPGPPRGLLPLPQSQQPAQQRVLEPGPPRGRPTASGSSARRQIPNPALLHQQSQGRLSVLTVPPGEGAGSGSGTSSASLARMERLTNSLGR